MDDCSEKALRGKADMQLMLFRRTEYRDRAKKRTHAAPMPTQAPGGNLAWLSWLLVLSGVLVVDDAADEVSRVLDGVPMDTLVAVVVKAVVLIPSAGNLAGTKSLCGHPISVLHAFDKQHPRKGGEVLLHAYHSASNSSWQSCGLI